MIGSRLARGPDGNPSPVITPRECAGHIGGVLDGAVRSSGAKSGRPVPNRERAYGSSNGCRGCESGSADTERGRESRLTFLGGAINVGPGRRLGWDILGFRG